LRGSLVVHATLKGESFWTFKHPTIGDAYSAMLRESPELLGIYIRGSGIEKLTRQVTCGDVEIEGAVVLPTTLFPAIIERLAEYKTSSSYKTEWMAVWGARRELLGFLAGRCSRQFLEAYLSVDVKLIDSLVKPPLYLEFSPEVDLAVRLFKFGLLPEYARKSLVEAVSKYAREGDDGRVLIDSDLRSMLSDKELRRLHEAIRTDLLPKIEQVRLAHQADRELDDDPTWHMRRFEQVLSAIEQIYSQSRRIRKLVERERSHVREWIDMNPMEESRSSAQNIGVDSPSANHNLNRSIFDDIDE